MNLPTNGFKSFNTLNIYFIINLGKSSTCLYGEHFVLKSIKQEIYCNSQNKTKSVCTQSSIKCIVYS